MNTHEQKVFYFDYHTQYVKRLLKEHFNPIRQGEIRAEDYSRYLIQDLHYMRSMAKLLRLLAMSEAFDSESKKILLEDVKSTRRIVASYSGFLARLGKEWTRVPISDSTKQYIEHQSSSVAEGPLEGLASLLPCYLYCPHYMEDALQAFENAVQKNYVDRKYFAALKRRMKPAEAVTWSNRIVRVWKQATYKKGLSPNCPNLQRIYKKSESLELLMIKESTYSPVRKPVKSASNATPSSTDTIGQSSARKRRLA